MALSFHILFPHPHCIFTADFQWLNDKVLVSCSKDGKIIQQLFSDAQRPVERAVSLLHVNIVSVS